MSAGSPIPVSPTPLWRAPRWALAVLLAGLASLGPFAIDTYLPAFAGISQSLGASALQMQQTLSVYLFAFAFMNLFHGALSDSFGRRPVVLGGLAVFTLSAIGCALAADASSLIAWRVLQGLCSGAGMVVSRAVVRDLFAPAQAQKVMSQITLFFGIAPAIAPLIGGWLYVHVGWRSIFWLLAVIGMLLWLANWRLLPETLPRAQRQSFHPAHLLRGYAQLLLDARFVLLALASGIPFNGMFIYVMSAPAFLGEIMGVAPTDYWWFFVGTIAGVMGGAIVSGRLAGRIAPLRQVRHGFVVMTLACALHIAWLTALAPSLIASIALVAMYSLGWSLMVPAVTLMALDLYPARRGLASSLQSTVGAIANGVVAGVIAPLVMHSAAALATAAAALMFSGLSAWVTLRRRWPELGSEPARFH